MKSENKLRDISLANASLCIYQFIVPVVYEYYFYLLTLYNQHTIVLGSGTRGSKVQNLSDFF